MERDVPAGSRLGESKARAAAVDSDLESERSVRVTLRFTRSIPARSATPCVATLHQHNHVGAGLRKSTKIHRAIDAFIGDVQPMPFDDVVVAHYGTIPATLRTRSPSASRS